MSAEPDEPTPGGVEPGELPRSEDLQELLGEIDETLSDPEAPPPRSKRFPAWLIWTLAGALGCGVAGAIATSNEWTGLGMSFSMHGLPAGLWGALNGALIGAMSGIACELWTRVRAERLKVPVALGVLLLLPPALLTLLFFLFDFATAMLQNDRLLAPSISDLPYLFRLNLNYGCALVGALVAHVGVKNIGGRLFLSWGVCMLSCLPLRAFGIVVLGDLVDHDWFWRAAFPYYLALPLSWWLLKVYTGYDPLPVLGEDSAEGP